MIAITPFDPRAATRAEWAAVHAFRRLRAQEDSPSEPVLDDAEYEREAREEGPLHRDRAWRAWAGGEIVGNSGVGFRREGTPDYELHAPYAWARVGVRAPWRRRGIATELLRPVLAFMREHSKTVAGFDTFSAEGEAFLRAVGATPKHRTIENRAAFAALEDAALARWRDGCPAALRWEVHSHRAPLERIAALLPQIQALQADIPLGELDSPPVRVEMPEWRMWYEELDRHGGDDMIVMLFDGETLTAFCQTYWDARFPDRVHQNLTAVARPWRGRGLGKAVKGAMMSLVRARHPDIAFVTTINANANAPMLAINAAMGFVEHRRYVFHQIGVADLARYLGDRTPR